MENNIHKELAEIAPTLAAMEKRNPFKVPDGYFSSLESKVIASVTKNTQDATIPEGYFDSLADRVMEQVAEKSAPKIIPLYRRQWLSIAASLILIIGAMRLVKFREIWFYIVTGCTALSLFFHLTSACLDPGYLREPRRTEPCFLTGDPNNYCPDCEVTRRERS